MHVKNLPADSAFIRKQLKAPLGWDNTTELTAQVVDSLNYLARLYQNVNFENADKSELVNVKRPHDVVAETEPETISLADFNEMMRGG